MSNDEPIVICNYEDKFAEDFARLNREWLDAFALYEDEDGNQLLLDRRSLIEAGTFISQPRAQKWLEHVL